MVPTEQLWKKIDQVEEPPWYFEEEDWGVCYFARDYTSHGGYSASEGNSLISNLKKKPHLRGTPQWRHKGLAIDQFARELLDLFGANGHLWVAPIPPSKPPGHPEYDSRIDDVLNLFARRRRNVHIEHPIVCRGHAPQHESGDRMNVDALFNSMDWAGFNEPPPHIVFIDDVVTTGASFKACQRHVRSPYPGLPVYGVFWARTIWPEQPSVADMDIACDA